MIVIIVGTDRAELGKVKKSELYKRFYESRMQLYKVYPGSTTRARFVHEDGHEDTDEVIVFPENSLAPFLPRNIDYSQERILAEITTHKFAAPTGLLGKSNIWMHKAEEWRTALGPYMVWIIVGLVLAYAFLA